MKVEVYRKANKFPVHWKLRIPKRYKRNAINGDLYCSWRISLNFCYEKNKIRNKFSSAGQPMRFVNSVINTFENKKHEPMIPSYLFNDCESKHFISISVPFCK